MIVYKELYKIHKIDCYNLKIRIITIYFKLKYLRYFKFRFS